MNKKWESFNPIAYRAPDDRLRLRCIHARPQMGARLFTIEVVLLKDRQPEHAGDNKKVDDLKEALNGC